MQMDEAEAETGATAGSEVLTPAESQALNPLSSRPPTPAAVNNAAANTKVSGGDEVTARQQVLGNSVSQCDDSAAEQLPDLGKTVNQSQINSSQTSQEPVDDCKKVEVCEAGSQPTKQLLHGIPPPGHT